MKGKTAVAIVVVAILILAGAEALGFQIYHYQSAMTGKVVRLAGQSWSTLYFESSSGRTVAEFNFTDATVGIENSTAGTVSWVFRIWHAPGFSFQSLNLTFSIGPWPANVWVSQFNYYTGDNPPLDVTNMNYSGGPSGDSGAVLTLSGFPAAENPTQPYGIGLTYNALATSEIGSTGVWVQLVLGTNSGVPLIGESYSGEFGFNLVSGH